MALDLLPILRFMKPVCLHDRGMAPEGERNGGPKFLARKGVTFPVCAAFRPSQLTCAGAGMPVLCGSTAEVATSPTFPSLTSSVIKRNSGSLSCHLCLLSSFQVLHGASWVWIQGWNFLWSVHFRERKKNKEKNEKSKIVIFWRKPMFAHKAQWIHRRQSSIVYETITPGERVPSCWARLQWATHCVRSEWAHLCFFCQRLLCDQNSAHCAHVARRTQARQWKTLDVTVP